MVDWPFEPRYTTIKADSNEWPRRSDYFDGSVSVSKGFGPATATLGYYDTFGSDASDLRRGSDTYKPGLVFSVQISRSRSSLGPP